MIKQIKVWKVTCDKCGKVYDGDVEWYEYTKKAAIVMIRDDGWWYGEKSRKVYCGDCRVY